MKMALISLVTAALLGLASYASNHSFDAGEVISVLFVTGLVAWTVAMYSRKPHPLRVAKPIRLPLKEEIHSFPRKTTPHQLAA